MKGYQNRAASSRHAKTICCNSTYRVWAAPGRLRCHGAAIPRCRDAAVRHG